MSEKQQRSVLINPIVARDIHEPHRAATPLELFYDLVYVVAIALLAAQLHHALTEWHHVGHAVFMYFWIFLCIWWPWNSYTWFASGFDTDDVQFRLASFLQMIGVIIIAVSVNQAFTEGNFMTMMIGYVIMRVPFILMWMKVYKDDPKHKRTAKRYIIGVLLAQMAWTLSILFFPSWYIFPLIWLFELFIPWYAERSTDTGENTKYHAEHIEERLGLLTIIVLGESILASVHAFEKIIEHPTPELMMSVGGALMILFSMWWLYFDDKIEERLHNETTAFIWAYGHYFIFAGAAAVGALISVNMDALTHHGHISTEYAAIGLAISVAIFLVAVWLSHDFLLKKTGIKKYELLLLAVVVMIIAVTTHSILFMGLAFACMNAIRVMRRHKQFKLQ